MSADESAQVCAAYDEALLLDLFSSTVTANELVQRTTAPAVCNHAFADFQADLDAFDALITSSEQEESLLLHIAAASDNGHLEADSSIGGLVLDDESSSTVSTANGAADAAPTAAKKPKCAPGGNVARKRRREEINALRESAVLLEKELRTLKAIANQPPSHSSNDEGRRHGPVTLSADQNVPRRWTLPPSQQKQSSKKLQPTDDTLLAKEKQARQLAELKNVQLSNFVSDHVAVAVRFEKLLFKRRPTMSSEDYQMTTRTSANVERMASEPHTAGDALVFEALAKNNDTQYLELERVFRAVGLADCYTNLVETRVDVNGGEAGGLVTLQFKSSQLMPFSVHAMNELALKNPSKRPAGNWSVLSKKQYQTGDLTSNWKSVPFKKQFKTGGITVNIRSVAKRYMENGRIVLVWEGLSEWPDKASGKVVTIQEKGWRVIQPYSKSSFTKKNQDPSTPLSLFQSYIHMTAGPTKGDEGATNRKQEPRPEHIAILSDVVKPLYEKQFAARIQDFENALFDDSLKRRSMGTK